MATADQKSGNHPYFSQFTLQGLSFAAHMA